MDLDTLLREFSQQFCETYRHSLKLTKNKAGFTLSGIFVRSVKQLETYGVQFPLAHTAKNFSRLNSMVCEFIKENSHTQRSEDLKNTKIAVDILTGDHYVIEDGGLQPWDFKTWKASIDPDDYEALYEEREYMIPIFDPYKPLSWVGSVLTATGEQEHAHYNLYKRPLYTYKPAPSNFPLCETFVRPFLETFLPREDERHYVMYWLHMLRFKRRQDVLVLIGMQGNGKNTLMQLATIIAGKHNSIIGSKKFGTEKFNGEVHRRKLVMLDEFSIQRSAKESLKCFSNDDITIELKGGDPVQVVNHCSFIVANNSKKSTDFEYKDRRFTCPQTSSQDLMDTWGSEKISAFKNAIETLDFEIELPYWLEKEVARLGLKYTRMNYITPYFYDLVETAKPEWFKEFKRQLRHKPFVTSADIFKATRTRVSDTKIKEHLDKESEERRHRKIEPFVIADIEIEDGKTSYVSKIMEVEADEEHEALIS